MPGFARLLCTGRKNDCTLALFFGRSEDLQYIVQSGYPVILTCCNNPGCKPLYLIPVSEEYMKEWAPMIFTNAIMSAYSCLQQFMCMVAESLAVLIKES